MNTQYFHLFKDAASRIRPINGGKNEDEAMKVLSNALLSEYSTLYNDCEYYSDMRYIETRLYTCDPFTKHFAYNTMNFICFLDDWRNSRKEDEYNEQKEWLDHQRFETSKVRAF